MPNRMIRDSARTSPTLAKLSHGAERCFWRLTTLADDFGRFNAEPTVVRALCFPTMLDRVRDRHVTLWLDELRRAGLIRCYRVGDKHVAMFLTWDAHQRIRAKVSKFPDPPTSADICCHPLSNAAVIEGTTEVESNVTNGAGRQRKLPADARGAAIPVAPSILAALERSGRLGAVPRLRAPEFWYAEAAVANGRVDLAAEVLKAEAWLLANPTRAPRKDLPRFLHNWLARAKDEQP